MAVCQEYYSVQRMSDSSLIPEGENLRRAIQWLSAQDTRDARAIEAASIKFDLTPLEEAFLLRHFKVSNQQDNS